MPRTLPRRRATGLLPLGLLGLVAWSACSPAPPPANEPSAPPAQAPPPAPPRPTHLSGLVVDAYGNPLGAGVRVMAVGPAAPEASAPAARQAERGGPAVTSDGEGRFELGAAELALDMPLRLVAASGTSLGSLRINPGAGVEQRDLRLAVLPLYGRRVRLLDQDGLAVRWPAEAVNATTLSSDPRLEQVEPGTIDWDLLSLEVAAGERLLIAGVRQGRGLDAPGFEWRLELPGYEYTRLLVELLPLAADGLDEPLAGVLERSVPGFGELELVLPAGLVGDGDAPLHGLALTLAPRAGGRPLVYELGGVSGERALLRDVPAGAFGARLELRGMHKFPPAAFDPPTVEVPVGGRAVFAPEGPAWSRILVEIELPDGGLHRGPVHLDLVPLGAGGVDPNRTGEFRSFRSEPYEFGPSPAGRYALHVRRLPGLVETGPVRDPFAQLDETELPWIELEVRPDELARVRLVIAP